MLFEKLLELLTALAVAAGGIAGIGNAAEHADPQAGDAALANRPAHVDETAAMEAGMALSRAAAVLAELEAVGPSDGLAQAAKAITQAMDNAPVAADRGLDTALKAVTTLPANDAPAGRPDDLPAEASAGPPTDIPAGRP